MGRVNELGTFKRGETFGTLIDRVDALVVDAIRRRAHGVLRGNEAASQLAQNAYVRPLPDVYNYSGYDRAAFEVLGIGGSQFEPSETEDAFYSQLLLTGVACTNPTHNGSIAVMQAFTPDGQVGPAIIQGVTQAKLSVQDEYHTFAYPGSDGVLKTGYGGSAQILYKESGTGEKLGVVRLGAPVEARYAGVLSTPLSTSIDSVEVSDLEAVSGPAILATTVTAYNTHHWPAKAGARCRIEWSIENERFEFYQIDC